MRPARAFLKSAHSKSSGDRPAARGNSAADCAFCACACAQTVQQSPLWAGRPVIFDRTGHTLSSAVGEQRARSGAGHAAPGVKRETAQRYGGGPRHSRTTANRRSRRWSASLGRCFADCGQVTASRSNIGGRVDMKTLTVESGAFLLRFGHEKIIRSAAALSAESRASSCFGWKAFRSADKRT